VMNILGFKLWLCYFPDVSLDPFGILVSPSAKKVNTRPSAGGLHL
jgi:hypothetical protein